jgi:hypothetical protein
MSFWSNLFRGRKEPATPDGPARVEVVPGRLAVRVATHDVANGPDAVPCWTYVTEGLWPLGQKEVVFSLRRRPGEGAGDFPRDPFAFFAQLPALAEQGRVVDAGDYSAFRAPGGFLGAGEPTGFAYVPTEALPGVALPPAGQSITALLLRPEEVAVVSAIGCYRLAALLGRANRYYPNPPWSDRDRPAVLTEADLRQSLLGKVGHLYCRGASARVLMEPSQPPPAGTRADREAVPSGRRITLKLPAGQRPRLRSALANVPDEGGLALLTDADPEANVRLVWRPGQERVETITPYWSDGSCLTGGFVALLFGPSLHDGGQMCEDGFAVTLAPATWPQVRAALTDARPLLVPAADANQLELEIAWLPGAVVPGPTAFEAVHTLLYQPDEVLKERVAHIDAFARYIKQVTDTAAAYWEALPRGAGQALALTVAVRPGGRARYWLDANPGGLDESAVAELLGRLGELPAPLVRGGPVAVAVRAILWGGPAAEGGWPFLPREWQAAAAGRSLLVPDGILDLIWPD